MEGMKRQPVQWPIRDNDQGTGYRGKEGNDRSDEEIIELLEETAYDLLLIALRRRKQAGVKH